MHDLTKNLTDIGLVIGVTGHRNLAEAELPHLRTEVQRFFETLHRDFPSLPLKVLSPLATGADQLVASVAIELNIPVIAVLPIPLAMYRDDFEDEKSLADFEQLLVQCELLELSLIYADNPTAANNPGHARDLQYAQAGIFTSSYYQVLLALWDGSYNG